MRSTFADKLTRALDRTDIPPHIQLAVLRDVLHVGRTKKEKDVVNTDIDWAALVASVQHVRTYQRSNRAKWAPYNRPIYEEYADMIEKAVIRIKKASMTVDANGAPVTLNAFTAFIKSKNAQRARDNMSLLGGCDAQWQSWIAPTDRADLRGRMAQHYKDSPALGSGNRVVPFTTMGDRKYAKLQLERLYAALHTVRRIHAKVGSSLDMNCTATTPYGALWLAAARMAERAVAKKHAGYAAGTHHMYEDKLPVSWHHALEPQMRQRLRDAARSPRGVALAGIERFYEPDEGGALVQEDVNVAHAEAALEDRDLFAE